MKSLIVSMPPQSEDLNALTLLFTRQTNISELVLSLGEEKIPEKPTYFLLKEIQKLKSLKVLELKLGIIHSRNFVRIISIIQNSPYLEKINLEEKSGLLVTPKHLEILIDILLGSSKLRDVRLRWIFLIPLNVLSLY